MECIRNSVLRTSAYMKHVYTFGYSRLETYSPPFEITCDQALFLRNSRVITFDSKWWVSEKKKLFLYLCLGGKAFMSGTDGQFMFPQLFSLLGIIPEISKDMTLIKFYVPLHFRELFMMCYHQCLLIQITLLTRNAFRQLLV